MSVTRDRDVPAEGVFLGTESGPGWVVFAASMIGLIATMTFIYAIAAISRSSFFVGDAEYVIGDLRTWGWILLVASIVQAATAIGVIAQVRGARWVGVAVLAVHATMQLLAFPAYPWWAGILFTLDVFVIYGLIAHGSK